jgi:hypothetical protein
MFHAPRTALPCLFSAIAVALMVAGDARAQVPPGGYTGPQYPAQPYPGQPYPPQPYPTQPYPQQPYPAQPYSAPAPTPTSSGDSASDIELGTLYAFAAGYGVGAGVWLDSELSLDDPGLKFLAPAILGVAAPAGVFLLNRPRMPRGMPAAIAAGMAIGAGEGAGIASYQFVHANEADAWGFRGFARSVFLGSTIGTAAGYVTAVTMEPSPKTSLLLGSSVAWGTVVGSMFGYGGSAAGSDFGAANDSASLGGLIGYNAGLVGAAALSTVWVPSYQSLEWMWIGFGAGAAVSLPVFLLYAGGDHDARRGLIFMGTASTLGLAAGAVFTMDSRDSSQSTGSGLFGASPTAPIQVTGGGFMPVQGGMGFQLSGLLF